MPDLNQFMEKPAAPIAAAAAIGALLLAGIWWYQHRPIPQTPVDQPLVESHTVWLTREIYCKPAKPGEGYKLDCYRREGGKDSFYRRF